MGVVDALKTFFMGAPLQVAVYMEDSREAANFAREELDNRERAAREKVALAEARLSEAIVSLSREREQLKAIFDSMPQCIYVSDMKTHEIYYANPCLVELFGDVQGHKCYQALHGVDTPCSFCNNHELLEGMGPRAWEFRYSQLNRTFKITNSVIDWPEVGRVRLQVATDITEIKEATARNEAILAAMPDMMFVLDRDGTYIDFHAENGNRKELTISPALIIGSKLSDANFPPHSVEFILGKIREALISEEAVTFEYELETPAGYNFYEARMVAFKEDQVLATVRNITGRKKQETELHKRQTEAEILAEVTECPVIFHRNNKVFLVNRAFTALTGYSKDDLDGSTDLVKKLFAPECVCDIDEAIRTKSIEPYQAIMLTKSGDPINVSIKSHYRRYNGNPEPVRIAVIMASTPHNAR